VAVHKKHWSSDDDRETRHGRVVTMMKASSTIEADVIVARLRDGGIHATRGVKYRGNDGVFDDKCIYVFDEDLEMAQHVLAQDVGL